MRAVRLAGEVPTTVLDTWQPLNAGFSIATGGSRTVDGLRFFSFWLGHDHVVVPFAVRSNDDIGRRTIVVVVVVVVVRGRRRGRRHG